MNITDRMEKSLNEHIDRLRGEKFACPDYCEVQKKLITEGESFVNNLPNIKMAELPDMPYNGHIEYGDFCDRCIKIIMDAEIEALSDDYYESAIKNDHVSKEEVVRKCKEDIQTNLEYCKLMDWAGKLWPLFLKLI